MFLAISYQNVLFGFVCLVSFSWSITCC